MDEADDTNQTPEAVQYIDWECTVHMLCIVDKSLSVFMTLRMCLCELCYFLGDILLSGFKPHGKVFFT